MSVKLNLSLNQKLTISQRMQQSLSLLSLSQEELNQAIQKELLENPLLEAIDDDKSDPAQTLGMFDFLPAKNNLYSPEEFLTEPESLKNHVLKQAEMSFFPKNIKIALVMLISYLDDRGYLNVDIKELAEKENIPYELLKEALSALQSLEPAGLGGRSLKECLLIQLKHKKEDTTKAGLIVQNHLSNIKDRKYKAIAYDLDISIKETLSLCRQIQSLEPNPARNFSNQPTVIIRPDIYIYKQNQDYHVILNQEDTPRLRFSLQYAQSIKKIKKLRLEEKNYLREQSTSAHWFIHALRQRQEKIKKIAYYFINSQRDFFEKGLEGLRPLKMQEMANDIGAHISTISRAVQNKYAYTPQGLIAFKSFFQKGLKTRTGGFVSMIKIKESIKTWIEREDPSHPLSDEDIRNKLYESLHVHLIKRSVSVYRSSMKIPPARVRQMGSKIPDLESPA